MPQIDATHDPKLRSWVASANGHPDFPIQNLPLGVFSPPGGGAPRAGVAIGDMVLDLAAAHAAGLFSGEAARAAEAASGGALNALFALGAGPRRALRARLSELLADGSAERAKVGALPARGRRLHAAPAGARSATTPTSTSASTTPPTSASCSAPTTRCCRTTSTCPIGYHGRASSVVPSGTPVRRPNGQRKRPDEAAPSFGPCRNLDYELELGVWIGPGNALGEPIPIGEAAEHIAGFCLLNDWSARDIQAWEYQPLGPFLAKNFGSTVSPWVVTPEALAPFRAPQPPRPEGDPAPLPYLLGRGRPARRARSTSSWRCCC